MISDQLAEKLPAGTLRTQTAVKRLLEENGRVVGVELESGETAHGDAVLIATESDAAASLTGLDLPTAKKSSTCFYFEAPEAPIDRPILVLNARPDGFVNEVVPCSVVSPDLAPGGRHLVSATVLGDVEEDDATAAERVKHEVRNWFPGRKVEGWRLLKVYRIPYAQMDQPVGLFDRLPAHVTTRPGLFLAGEFNVCSSINGAMQAGIQGAEAILASGLAASEEARA